MKMVPGLVAVGLALVFLLYREWDFGAHAVARQAVVIDSFVAARSGKTIATVLYNEGGRPIRATLRAWYCPLHDGEAVPILALADDPENVALDRFWQRHFGSAIAVSLLAVLGATIGSDLAWRRRRQSIALLRDDFVPPRVQGTEALNLSIDTAPRLWDRELDG